MNKMAKYDRSRLGNIYKALCYPSPQQKHCGNCGKRLSAISID